MFFVVGFEIRNPLTNKTQVERYFIFIEKLIEKLEKQTI